MSRDLHTVRLIEAAERLGIVVTDLHERWFIDAIRLTYQGREEYVIDGRNFSSLIEQADALCRHKQATKDVMAELGLPVPASVVFDEYSPHADVIADFLQRYCPAVVKPVDAAHGRGVEMGIETPAQVESYYNSHRDDDPLFLLEEQVAGDDLRMLAIGGRLAAACSRRPARVIGDGARTVAELITVRNAELAVHNPCNRIEVDQQVDDLLGEQGLDLHAIIAAGRAVQLKRVANIAQGGAVIDCTDDLHPGYADCIRLVGERLQMKVFALDAITTDHTRDPMTHAKFMEINCKSDWLHHTFSERRQHDVPTMILRDLFDIPSPS